MDLPQLPGLMARGRLLQAPEGAKDLGADDSRPPAARLNGSAAEVAGRFRHLEQIARDLQAQVGQCRVEDRRWPLTFFTSYHIIC